MQWLSKIDDVLDYALTPRPKKQQVNDGVDGPSEQQEEVPNEQLFVKASIAQSPAFNSVIRPTKYPGMVKRTPASIRRTPTENNDYLTQSIAIPASKRNAVARPGDIYSASRATQDDESSDSSSSLRHNPLHASSRAPPDVHKHSSSMENSKQKLVAIEIHENGGGKDTQRIVDTVSAVVDLSRNQQSRQLQADEDDVTSYLGNDEVSTIAASISFESKEQKEELPHAKHYIDSSNPISSAVLHRPARYPGSLRRTPLNRRPLGVEVDDDEESCSSATLPVNRRLLSACVGSSQPKEASGTNGNRGKPKVENSSETSDTDEINLDSHPTESHKRAIDETLLLTHQESAPETPIRKNFPAVLGEFSEPQRETSMGNGVEKVPSTLESTQNALAMGASTAVSHENETTDNNKEDGETAEDPRAKNSFNASHSQPSISNLSSRSASLSSPAEPSYHRSLSNLHEKDVSGVSKPTELSQNPPVEAIHTQPKTYVDANADADSPVLRAGDGIRQQEREQAQTPVVSVPRNVEFRSEFEVKGILSTWNDEHFDSAAPFDNGLNCHGVVHVRVLRAQRLPCSVGSVIQAAVSLKPWKGRVKSAKARSFAGPLESSGVCASWDEDESPSISVVHAYSSEDSPVPSLEIALLFSPLGLFDVTMCSLTVSCRRLLMSPMVAKRQWLTTTTHDAGAAVGVLSVDNNRTPLVEIEAMFEPADYIKRSESAPIDIHESGGRINMELPLIEDTTVPPASASLASKSKSQHGEISPSDFSLSFDSRRKGDAKAAPHPPHLLRLITYWSPANCCVCDRIIWSGLWKEKAYHCEECNVDCCSDCQLQVDVQLPCGSELTQSVVKKMIRNRLTLSNILHAVAPLEELHVKAKEGMLLSSGSDISKQKSIHASTSRIGGDNGGIGTLKIDFFQAHLFEETLPAETERNLVIDRKGVRFRSGDYYIRITTAGSKKTARTRTIQGTGRPRFESGEMRFNVSHYGTEFRVEVVDSATDKPVGVTLLTTQSLIQEQRDLMVAEKGIPLLSFHHGPEKFDRKRRLILELRTGLKTGFSSDFYAPSLGQSYSQSHEGEIVGYIEALVGLEEDTGSLYGKVPYECPPRPPDELDMHLFQRHLSRVSLLIEDFQRSFEMYLYIVGWKNPAVTSLALMVFVFSCFRHDPAYIGSVPFFFLVAFMLYLSMIRRRGHPKNRFLHREIDAHRKAEKVAVDYTLHRPVGLLSLQVLQAKNIRSPEHGLPGNVSCRTYWDPTRYATEKRRKSIISLDKAATSTHEIGTTDSLYAMNPVWERMAESDGSKRLKLILSHGDGSFGASEEQKSRSGAVDFPILQPFEAVSKDLPALVPWSDSHGAVVVEVKFHDILNILPGSEYALGEVSIPFASLVEAGELEGWFHILGVGATRVLPGLSAEDHVGLLTDGSKGQASPTNQATEDSMLLFLRIKWTPPNENTGRVETQREASVVVQEEMVRQAIMSRQQQQKLDLIGSSIGAINKFRGLSGNLLVVQNTLGSILDYIEAIRNGFNFSDPYKSSVLLAGLFVLWLFLVLVQTWVIVLTAGLAQFGYTFYERFGYLLKAKETTERKKRSKEDEAPDAPSPIVVWIMNAIRGLPTDEDLRQTYFWESRRCGALEKSKHAEEKRKSRLQRLWRAQWYSSVKILRPSDTSNDFYWVMAFAIIQGHRFLWWRSAEDFDNGEVPLGRIFLAGHAGLATPSPLELRSFQHDELARTVCIFGRGEENQERVTILASAVDAKEALEEMIVSSATMKKD